MESLMSVSPNRRITSKDVAREVGVSQSTVSRVYNGSGLPVHPDTREKVLAAAEKMGYHPSIIARSLNSQSTRIIGIVMQCFDSVFNMKLLDHFTKRIQDAGYSVMLFNYDNEKDVEKNFRKALEYQVDGIIITSALLASPLVEGFLRYGSPVFLFNRISDGLNVNSVCSDNYGGGEMAAEYLISKGHRKIVFISGLKTSSTNRDRQQGFMYAASAKGLSDIPVIEGDYTYHSGFQAGEKLLKSKIQFDSVFCTADEMAMGVMDFFRYRTNYKIPQDISLMGFDGITLENTIAYPLTTIEQPLERMVDKTIELMMSKINNKTQEVIHHFLPDRILERSSVADRYTDERF